jgi:hypothetical protein
MNNISGVPPSDISAPLEQPSLFHRNDSSYCDESVNLAQNNKRARSPKFSQELGSLIKYVQK